MRQTKQALLEKNSIKLRLLSNQTIHDACNYQDAGSITIGVMLYALSKLIERGDYLRINNWDSFTKKFNSFLDLAINALNENNQEIYEDSIQKARNVLTLESISLRPYIDDVLKKASINKGSKIHEHGISIERTSKLLGISQWELSDYIGQKTTDIRQNITLDIKKRAKLAMEFFS